MNPSQNLDDLKSDALSPPPFDQREFDELRAEFERLHATCNGLRWIINQLADQLHPLEDRCDRVRNKIRTMALQPTVPR